MDTVDGFRYTAVHHSRHDGLGHLENYVKYWVDGIELCFAWDVGEWKARKCTKPNFGHAKEPHHLEPVKLDASYVAILKKIAALEEELEMWKGGDVDTWVRQLYAKK